MTDRLELVVQTPRAARVAYVVIPTMGVGALALMVLRPSAVAFVMGGAVVLLMAFLSWEMFSALRHLHGAPMVIEATRNGIANGFWRVAWDDVERIYFRAQGGKRGLFIVPRSGRAIERTGTLASKVDGRLNAILRDGSVRIMEVWIDRSLETLAGELEHLAGRPLLASAGA